MGPEATARFSCTQKKICWQEKIKKILLSPFGGKTDRQAKPPGLLKAAGEEVINH